MKAASILLVDDDERILFMTRELLEFDGYRVVTWSQGLGTSAVMHREQPDLVLLDVNMPGLSGNKLVDIFHRDPFLRDIPVVLYSSNDEAELRRLTREHGAADYICKGDPAELRRKVTLHLRNSRNVSGAPGREDAANRSPREW